MARSSEMVVAQSVLEKGQSRVRGTFRYQSYAYPSVRSKSRQEADVIVSFEGKERNIGKVFCVVKTGRWHFCHGWGPCKTAGDADDREGAARQLLDAVMDDRMQRVGTAIQKFNEVAQAAGEQTLGLVLLDEKGNIDEHLWSYT